MSFVDLQSHFFVKYPGCSQRFHALWVSGDVRSLRHPHTTLALGSYSVGHAAKAQDTVVGGAPPALDHDMPILSGLGARLPAKRQALSMLTYALGQRSSALALHVRINHAVKCPCTLVSKVRLYDETRL